MVHVAMITSVPTVTQKLAPGMDERVGRRVGGCRCAAMGD